MRVWIVNQYAYAPFHSAGTRHWSLARRLTELGHDVTVVSTSFFHKTRQETRLEPGEPYRHELVDGVPFLWLRTPPYKGNTVARLRNITAFARAVWGQQGLRNQPRPDVILGSSPSLLAAWAARRLAKRFGVPFVLEIRDLWPETLVSLGKMTRRHPLVRFFGRVERGLYRAADRIVTLLPGSAEYIAQHGGARDRIDHLPNGIDLSIAPTPVQSSTKGKFKLLYAGAHGAANGLDLLLDAAKLIANGPLADSIEIELIGEGPEKQRLQRRATDEGIANISFRPTVSKQAIYGVLQTADAFLMLLEDSPVFKWGVSPNKLFDYMAMARPVLFSVSTDLNPIREAQAGVTIPPGDALTLATGIEQLAQLPQAERDAMGKRGRDYVEQHHDLRLLGNRLETILKTACGQAPARKPLNQAA